jgi:hypothetical protein
MSITDNYERVDGGGADYNKGGTVIIFIIGYVTNAVFASPPRKPTWTLCFGIGSQERHRELGIVKDNNMMTFYSQKRWASTVMKLRPRKSHSIVIWFRPERVYDY